MTMRRGAAIFALCVFLTGCPEPPQRLFEPSIGNITVSGAAQGDAPTVTAAIVLPGGSDLRVRSATLQFRSTREPDRPFVPVEQEMTSVPGGSAYQGTLPALNYGPYEVEVRVVFRPFDPAEPTPGDAEDQPQTKTQTFFVGADEEECFGFTSDLQGWTFDGFYDGDAGPASQCPDPLAHTAANQGTAAVLLTANCFPSAEPQSGSWRFDYVSPDVTSRPGWAATEGILVLADANFPVRLVPILTRTGDPSEISAPDEYDLSDPTIAFQEIVQALAVPEGSQVSGARLRVFVDDPVLAGAEGMSLIGAVCPIPNRPG